MCDYSYANCFTDEARQDAIAALDAVDRWLDVAEAQLEARDASEPAAVRVRS